MTDLTLQGKIINQNNFKTDIFADAIEESRLYFEDTRDGKGELIKPKYLSYEKWTQQEDMIYKYFESRKKSRDVTLSYITRKYTSSPKDSAKRDGEIIYQEILVKNMFTRVSRIVLDIIKELNLGTDAETWINGLKCGSKAMQELQANYYGTSEGAQRKQVARADLKKILYKNETTLKFEKYVKILRGFSMCWKNIVSHSTRSRWSRIY